MNKPKKNPNRKLYATVEEGWITIRESLAHIPTGCKNRQWSTESVKITCEHREMIEEHLG